MGRGGVVGWVVVGRSEGGRVGGGGVQALCWLGGG